MNRCEKIAWFNLAVLSVSVALFITLFLLMRMIFDVFMSAQIASSAFSIVAVCSFGPLMFKKTGAVIDDRGVTISQQHDLYKSIMFLVLYISILFGIWVLNRVFGFVADELNLFVIYFIVSIFVLFGYIIFLYFKRQKESVLVSEDQTAADVLLFGPDMDERDLMIQKNARWCGFGVFWFFYVFGFMGVWARAHYLGIRSVSINVSVLPLFVFGAFILIYTVDSITRVILYRRGI